MNLGIIQFRSWEDPGIPRKSSGQISGQIKIITIIKIIKIIKIITIIKIIKIIKILGVDEPGNYTIKILRFPANRWLLATWLPVVCNIFLCKKKRKNYHKIPIMYCLLHWNQSHEHAYKQDKQFH